MVPSRVLRRSFAAAVLAIPLALFSVTAVAAHEERTVAGYDMEVGFIGEPVFVGDKSGLEFFVHKGDTGVTGLEQTLKAEVIYGTQKRDLPIDAREGEDGAYESTFIPTAAGPYTFHIFGTIEGQAIDESFTSSPDGFNEVQEQSTGQFPTQFPSQAQFVADVQAAKDASAQTTIALIAGVAGIVVGLIALGVAVSGRRRAA